MVIVCPLCLKEILDTDDQEEFCCGNGCCQETIEVSEEALELLRKWH